MGRRGEGGSRGGNKTNCNKTKTMGGMDGGRSYTARRRQVKVNRRNRRKNKRRKDQEEKLGGFGDEFGFDEDDLGLDSDSSEVNRLVSNMCLD